MRFKKCHLHWWFTFSETQTFYKALSQVGTDFSLMTPIFPNRTRRELKVCGCCWFELKRYFFLLTPVSCPLHEFYVHLLLARFLSFFFSFLLFLQSHPSLLSPPHSFLPLFHAILLLFHFLHYFRLHLLSPLTSLPAFVLPSSTLPIFPFIASSFHSTLPSPFHSFIPALASSPLLWTFVLPSSPLLTPLPFPNSFLLSVFFFLIKVLTSLFRPNSSGKKNSTGLW